MLKYYLIGLSTLTFIGTNADASPDRYQQHWQRHQTGFATTARNHAHVTERYASGSEVVAHPASCPRTMFCGCGAARELGLSDRSLWLVKSWYKFPRAAAARGMAAIWGARHVAVIREVHGDGTATVYDANSGGGLTRVHRVSLAGLTIVDPDGRGSTLTTSRSEPVAQRHVKALVVYRHRSDMRNAVAGNWPAYRPDADYNSRRHTWRVARAEGAGGFWH